MVYLSILSVVIVDLVEFKYIKLVLPLLAVLRAVLSVELVLLLSVEVLIFKYCFNLYLIAPILLINKGNLLINPLVKA